MKFKNVNITDDELDFEVSVSAEEASYLINHAVNTLLAQGVISLTQVKEDEEVNIHGNCH